MNLWFDKNHLDVYSAPCGITLGQQHQETGMDLKYPTGLIPVNGKLVFGGHLGLSMSAWVFFTWLFHEVSLSDMISYIYLTKLDMEQQTGSK